MKGLNKAEQSTYHGLVSAPGATYSQRPWMTLARVACIIIVIPDFVLFIITIPSAFAFLHHLRASGAPVFTVQLTRADIYMLQASGLPLDFYAACMVALCLLFQINYAAIGLLLFWRKSGDRVALPVSFALVISPIGLTSSILPPFPRLGRGSYLF